jgi:hypothetical protein
MFKNTALILSLLVKRVFVVLMVFNAGSLFLGKIDWAFSSVLGAFFSYIIFRRLIASQESVLNTRNKNQVFIHLFLRLIIYAFPISAAFLLSDYLNFPILLLFLFAFQVLFISMELAKNLLRYKKRMKNGRIR